ncbi:MAG: putative metal-binding motif-containing protein [Myxococcota bacterium]
MRTLMGWAVALGFLLGAGPNFEGCGEDGPPDPAPLPEGPRRECVLDIDCNELEEFMCVETRCFAGECMQVAPTLDRDEDGFPPVPCGNDCNDLDGTVFVGASETCDEIDEDCDGMIDEGAEIRVLQDRASNTSDQSELVPWRDGFLVTSPANASAIPYASDFSRRPAFPLYDGAAQDRVWVAANASGQLMVLTEEGGWTFRVLAPGPDGSPVVVQESQPTSFVALELEDVASMGFGTSFAFVYDIGVGTSTMRAVRLDPLGPEVFSEAWDRVTPLTLGTDGTHLVVPVDEELVFLDAAGTEVARFEIGGLAGPLISSEGAVLALVQRDGMVVIVPVRVDGPAPDQALPSDLDQLRDRVAIAEREGGFFLIGTNGQSNRSTAFLLDENLRTVRGTAPAGMASRRVQALGLGAAGVGAAFGNDEAELRLLEDCF